MSVEIREIVLKAEINVQAVKQVNGLTEEQLNTLKKDLLSETLRSVKKISRNGFNR